ncbi:MAG TPA: hypothetical protein VK674_05410 [Candidatus Limnocylindria bacterium]|nr:hypothetical protein [Candidatus Limnocylindria bacterium]
MKTSSLHKNQSGLVSFLIVTVVMLILSLIVLAFARLVSREQIQTLDRQLNAQAFYAAESGVNDALNALARPAPPTGYNNNCTGAGSFMATAGLTNDLGNGISYSCLLVDTTVPDLQVDDLSTETSVVFPIRPQGPAPITELNFTITDGSDGDTLTGCPAAGNYPGSWPGGCSIGVLRMELVRFNGNPNRDDLLRNRAVAYIQPSTSGSPAFTWAQSSDSAAYNTGHRHAAVCTVGGAATEAQCTVDLTGLNLQNGYLRLRSIYRTVDVTISAETASGPVSLIGSQAEVDVTGRATDVVKRIKVRAPIPIGASTDPMPEFALYSRETLCKRFQVTGPPANVLSFGIFMNETTGADNDCNPGQTTNN